MLRDAEAKLATGVSISDVTRDFGASEMIFHRWRNRHGGMDIDSTRRVRELEKENARLKKIVADQAVDTSILKGVSRKTLSPIWRRATIVHACGKLKVSERRACRVIGQSRSTQGYTATRMGKYKTLLGEILKAGNGLVVEQSEEWLTGRRCLDMEDLREHRCSEEREANGMMLMER